MISSHSVCLYRMLHMRTVALRLHPRVCAPMFGGTQPPCSGPARSQSALWVRDARCWKYMHCMASLCFRISRIGGRYHFVLIRKSEPPPVEAVGNFAS